MSGTCHLPCLSLPQENKFMRPVFKSIELQKHFEENGYNVVDLLLPEDVQQLQQIYNENRVEDQPAIERTTSTVHHDTSRNIKRLAGEILMRRLEECLINYKVLFSGFIAKIPGKPSQMRLHQDPTFVDESRFKGLNVWCPLIDVNEKNGALWIIPHSDRFFDGFRGQPARAYQVAEISDEVIATLGTLIPMRAGQAVIYDMALFHYSLENSTDQTRIASTTAMIPEEATAIYHHHNKMLNTLEVYEMDEDFMLRYYSEYLKTGVVEAKLLSSIPFIPPRKISFTEFEEKFRFYNQSLQSL